MSGDRELVALLDRVEERICRAEYGDALELLAHARHRAQNGGYATRSSSVRRRIAWLAAMIVLAGAIIAAVLHHA